ncbi:MAG: hypothetical protein Q8906_16850, partial [Bacillota bacterium]|nr:hypothetical protein [Bacillota bacterium]MDP4172282.1 hypothetical protein [Bacillota bacterium]
NKLLGKGDSMIYLMSDAGATLSMLLLLILMIVILFLRRSMVTKLTISLIAIFLIISIPVIGHSDWNKKTRLIYDLNHLKTNRAFGPSTDIKVVKEITNLQHPLQIKRLSSVKQPFDGGTLFSDEVVEINGKRYNIRLACYLTPLPFTPYETWEINSITKNIQ